MCFAFAIYYFLSFRVNTRKSNYERSVNAQNGGDRDDGAGLQEFHGEKARIKTQKEEHKLWQQYL